MSHPVYAWCRILRTAVFTSATSSGDSLCIVVQSRAIWPLIRLVGGLVRLLLWSQMHLKKKSNFDWKKKQNRNKFATDLPSNLMSSALILKSASLSALLLMGMNKMVQKTNKQKKKITDTLALLSSSLPVYRWAKWRVIAERTRTQRRDITATASTPGGSQCLPPGAEVFPRGSCRLWNQMNLRKSSQESWKKTSGRDDSNNNPNNKPWYII